ncbi:MAG TPA: hypothetical protein VLN49_14395 [Gemmatimonadaceae bacterium]|nr:hypothetical protein [Gemmatimonadaceae bacterium]
MKHPRRRIGLNGLRNALDEVRFGTQRTLNLRESLPSADAAVARAESWLRQQQVDRAAEVLIITGRGNQSEGGVSVVREAVLRLLHVLRRRGVVSGHQEHTPGSFIVKLAPVAALWESARRKGGRGAETLPAAPPSLDALDIETRTLLRALAERAIDGLGVKDASSFVEGEMLKQFGMIAKAVGTGPGREERLRSAIRNALEQQD